MKQSGIVQYGGWMLVFIGLWILTLPVVAFAAEPAWTMKQETAKPPAEVAESLRAALQDDCITLSNSDGPAFQIWLVKTVPLSSKPAAPIHSLECLKETTYLGIIRLPKAIKDFRNDFVAAGVYTMRFAIQPVDDDHSGTAPSRQFVLLTKVAFDTSPDGISTHDALVKASKKETAATHPSPMHIQALRDADGSFPRLGQGDWDSKRVEVKLPAQVAGENGVTSIAFGLVYFGRGKT
jgi:hypothetical protein